MGGKSTAVDAMLPSHGSGHVPGGMRMSTCLLEPAPKKTRVTADPRVAVGDNGRQRWPAFDALRGLAMLLGVVLHASVSYMPHTMPHLLWPARDSTASPLFDWIFWTIHSFRLPLFFALAGFFAVLLHESRGTWGFLAQRSRRLLVPLLGAALIILPLTWGIWSWGWLRAGLCTVTEIRRLKYQPAIQFNLYGPAHLWFLEYLYVMCLMFAGVRCLLACRSAERSVRARVPHWRDRWLASRWFPLVPAVPAAVLVWLDLGAVYDFHNTFAVEPLRFAYYGIFFLTGVWLARSRSSLDSCLGDRTNRLLVLCLPLLVANGLLLEEYLEHGISGLGRLALAGTCALLASVAMFALLGLALRCCRREHPLLRYLADASYWIYLVHFPLVGLAHVLLAPVPGTALVKFAVVTVLVMAFGLASYQLLVRHTFLGRFLNGTKPPAATHLI
jgi:peptidoglycan/LPS O-acetylase OafA/YrhL